MFILQNRQKGERMAKMFWQNTLDVNLIKKKKRKINWKIRKVNMRTKRRATEGKMIEIKTYICLF